LDRDEKARILTRNVISITRMTVHNGPGIRTLIMMKGCPLHCLWCSTPESQKPEPELAVFAAKCIYCGDCMIRCPRNAIKLTENSLSIDRKLCNSCGKCVEFCHAEALRIIGRPMSVEELVDEVKKDTLFITKSGGGVTISGGEPLLETGFNCDLYRRFKEESINIGVDTSGHVPWGNIEPLLEYIDFFLLDIKHLDPEKHKLLTGVSNELILQNARSIAGRNIPIYLRLPIIPGYNDSEENLRRTCQFALTVSSLVEVDLLPLHHLGKARYESLDRIYPIDDLPLIDQSVLEDIRKLVTSYGLKCVIVG
jgi:pyruvate formate lyase activating enzyme